MDSPSNSRRLEAFQTSVAAWAAYTATPAGQLRSTAILHYLRTHLAGPPLRILDAGCGIGEIGASLACEGYAVTMLDFSPAMLEEARRRCPDPRIRLVCGDANQGALFTGERFEVVLCHSLLEFVDDPLDLLGHLAMLLAPGGIMSVVAGNRNHATMREALVRGDFGKARLELDRETPAMDLFSLPRHTFYPDAVRELMEAGGLSVIAEYGIRVFADLLEPRPYHVDDVLDLELVAGARLPYRRIARFVQFLGVK